MSQSINTSEAITATLGAQSNQADSSATGSATIKLQENLVLADPEGFQNQVLKSCLQTFKMVVYPISWLWS